MPRSKEDFLKITTKRRASILNTSLKLFAIDGYDAVSVDDITKACHCSHGLFYHYFDSKKDLFEKLIKDITTTCHEDIKAIDYNQKPLIVIREINRFLLKYLRDAEKCYILYMYLTFHLQRTLPKTSTREEDFFKIRLIETIKKGQEEGVFEDGDANDYVQIYLSAFQGLANTKIRSAKKTKFKTIDENALLNIFLKKEVTHA